jgi:hypothetical protein
LNFIAQINDDNKKVTKIKIDQAFKEVYLFILVVVVVMIKLI